MTITISDEVLADATSTSLGPTTITISDELAV